MKSESHIHLLKSLAVGVLVVGGLSCSGTGASTPTASQLPGEASSVATSLPRPTNSLGEATTDDLGSTSTTSDADLAGEPSQHPVGQEWREKAGVDVIYDLDSRSYDEYQRRVQACMASRGFDYIPAKYGVDNVDYYRAINPLNEAVAVKFGYHTPPVQSDAGDRNQHSAPFDLALNGTDDDQASGCATPSYKAVHSVTDPVFAVAQQLLNSLDSAVYGFDDTADGQALIKGWAQCMRQQGYDFNSHHDAFTRFIDAPTVTDTELSTRAADLSCDTKGQLTITESNWERAHFEQWQDQYATQWADMVDQISKTTRILEGLEGEKLG